MRACYTELDRFPVAASPNTRYLGWLAWLRHSQRIVVLLFGLGLVLRLAAVAILGVPDPVEHTESGQIAAGLIGGEGYAFDFYGLRPEAPLRSFVPPLYTLLVAFCLAVSSHPALLLGSVQALLSSLTPVCMYFAGRRLAGVRVALVAGLATAVYPVFVIQAARPLPLSLNAFLLSFLVLLMLYMPADRGLPIYAVGIGIVLGLLSLSRTSMLGLFPGFALWLWLNCHSYIRWPRTLLVTASVVTIILSPWLIRNYRSHGQMLPLTTNGGMTFWNGNNPFTTGSAWDVYADKARAYAGLTRAELPGEGIIVLKPYILPNGLQDRGGTLSELALDRALYEAGLEFVRQHPKQWFALLVQKTRSFWWFRPNLAKDSELYRKAWALPYQVLYTLVVVLFVSGIVASWRQWRTYAFLYYLFGYLTVTYALFNVVTRYRWEIEGVLLLFGAIGIASTARWLMGLRSAASVEQSGDPSQAPRGVACP